MPINTKSPIINIIINTLTVLICVAETTHHSLEVEFGSCGLQLCQHEKVISSRAGLDLSLKKKSIKKKISNSPITGLIQPGQRLQSALRIFVSQNEHTISLTLRHLRKPAEANNPRDLDLDPVRRDRHPSSTPITTNPTACTHNMPPRAWPPKSQRPSC